MNGPRAYYNEFDAKAAAWLRELIRRGCIMEGDVDDRSVVDVRAADLVGYTRCHFFAGIGGWDYALRLAGWPEDRPVWTGSCPCQPFSVAGKAGGVGDERHLWPAFRALIAECRPAVCLGEQVASKDGRLWLAGVRADLETLGYAVGGADLCAAGIGAPHIRQRLYWMANAKDAERRTMRTNDARGRTPEAGGPGDVDRLANASLGGLGTDGSAPGHGGHIEQCGEVGGVGNAGRNRSAPGIPKQNARHEGNSRIVDYAGSKCGFWRNSTWLPCRDGKARRIESGTAPLAHGVPARVVRLRGYGNAIVPPLAAEFIGAVMEVFS
jgi:DNA (cytosine-5)-methyltransferase 1